MTENLLHFETDIEINEGEGGVKTRLKFNASNTGATASAYALELVAGKMIEAIARPTPHSVSEAIKQALVGTLLFAALYDIPTEVVADMMTESCKVVGKHGVTGNDDEIYNAMLGLLFSDCTGKNGLTFEPVFETNQNMDDPSDTTEHEHNCDTCPIAMVCPIKGLVLMTKAAKAAQQETPPTDKKTPASMPPLDGPIPEEFEALFAKLLKNHDQKGG